MSRLVTIETYHGFIYPTWNLTRIGWHALVGITIRHLGPSLILTWGILGHKAARIIPITSIIEVISIKVRLQIARGRKTIKIIIFISWSTIPIIVILIIPVIPIITPIWIVIIIIDIFPIGVIFHLINLVLTPIFQLPWINYLLTGNHIMVTTTKTTYWG
jgi:hypothetical protein